jgi:hypothetical protein
VQRIEHGEMESPGLFQQKPDTQLFFFRKTSSSTLKYLKRLRPFSTKAGMQFFCFRKTSSPTRKSSGRSGFALLIFACSKILIQALDFFGGNGRREPVHVGAEVPNWLEPCQ